MRAALAFAVLVAGCSGSSPQEPFTEKDLQGTWSFANVYHAGSVMDGGTPGWVRGTAEFDAAGKLSVTGEDSLGRAVAGSGMSMQIDADGFLGTSDLPTFAGRMNKGRDFFAATATEDGISSLRIAMKAVPGTKWSIADVASRQFSYHYLAVGTAPSWEHGVASVDATGGLTLTQRVATAGPQADAAIGTLSVDAGGMVMLDGDPTWMGWLSSDKTLLVATKTRNDVAHGYAAIVLTLRGQSYAPPDLVGSYGFFRLVASPIGGGWASGRMKIDVSGTATMTSITTNTGPQPVPAPQTVTIDSEGVIHNPASATYHSVMSFHKDLTVRTETTTTPATSYALLSIGVK